MYLIPKRYIGLADVGCPKIVRKLPESRPKFARKLSRDINKEMVTKIVPVRAVDLSIGPFCTEFRCERFRDDDVFGIGFDFFVDSRSCSGRFLVDFRTFF